VSSVRGFACVVGSIVPASLDAYARVSHRALPGEGGNAMDRQKPGVRQGALRYAFFARLM
jgi:hypothetical protein